MKRSLLFPLGALIIVFSITATPVHAKTAGEVLDAVSSSIVAIRTLDAKGTTLKSGSGVALAKDLIATNFHLIEGAAKTQIIHKGVTYSSSLRHIDRDRDVCSLTTNGISAPAVMRGSTRHLKIGARVYAIGASQESELTVSEGTVSRLYLIEGGQYLQITTPIPAVSSGGGLFDEDGLLIGLATSYSSGGQKLNFAVPAEWIGELPKRHSREFDAAKITTTKWINEALVLLNKEDWANLLTHSYRWTEAKPEETVASSLMAIAWTGMAAAHWKSGRPLMAMECYQQALQINPKDAETWYDMGCALSKSGQTSRVMEVYDWLKTIDPVRAEDLRRKYILP